MHSIDVPPTEIGIPVFASGSWTFMSLRLIHALESAERISCTWDTAKAPCKYAKNFDAGTQKLHRDSENLIADAQKKVRNTGSAGPG